MSNKEIQTPMKGYILILVFLVSQIENIFSDNRSTNNNLGQKVKSAVPRCPTVDFVAECGSGRPCVEGFGGARMRAKRPWFLSLMRGRGSAADLHLHRRIRLLTKWRGRNVDGWIYWLLVLDL